MGLLINIIQLCLGYMCVVQITDGCKDDCPHTCMYVCMYQPSLRVILHNSIASQGMISATTYSFKAVLI